MSTAAIRRRVLPAPIELIRARDAFAGRRLLRDGALHHRVRAGVYAPRAAWEVLAPWDKYLARVHAYALINPGAVFAYESAAALLGLPVFGSPLMVHVYDFGRAASRRFGDVFVHTSIRPLDVVTVGGLTMTSAAATAVDLMRVLPPAFGLAVGDAAIAPRQGADATLADLQDAAAGIANRRGINLLDSLLTLVDARAESPGESIGRAVTVWSGFEAPDLQREFTLDGFTDRVDYAWPSVRAIAETDGYAKYEGETPEETIRRVIAEKRREDRLRRQCRGFARWTMADAIAVTPVVRELERIGIPRVSTPRSVLLRMTNPRSVSRAGSAKHHIAGQTPSEG